MVAESCRQRVISVGLFETTAESVASVESSQTSHMVNFIELSKIEQRESR